MLISRLQQIKSACITFPFSSKTHSCRLKYEAAFVFFYLKSMTHCFKYHYRFGLSATVIAGKLYVLYNKCSVATIVFSVVQRSRSATFAEILHLQTQSCNPSVYLDAEMFVFSEATNPKVFITWFYSPAEVRTPLKPSSGSLQTRDPWRVQSTD